MKNVLLIIPYGSVGGIERLAVTFYENLKKWGYNVKVIKIIALHNDIVNFGKDEYRLSEKDLSDLSPIQRILFYIKIPFLIRNIIKQNKIDISLAFGDMANSFSAISGTKEKKVASLHAVKSIEFKNIAGINKFFKWSLANSYKRFDKVVAISEAIKQDLIENCNYHFQNLIPIYNPHDFDLIKERSQESLSENEQLIFEKKVILFLGRLSIQKAPWQLIKAFNAIKQQFPDHQLVLIGDGDTNVEYYLKQLLAKQGDERIFFLGRKNNPYKYLARAECLALSSFYEGTPNVIVEAMALNIPILTSNCTDGINEMMIDKINQLQQDSILTDAGIITNTINQQTDIGIPQDFSVTPEDHKFAEALIQILDADVNDKVRNADKTKLLSKFDLEKVIKAYLN